MVRFFFFKIGRRRSTWALLGVIVCGAVIFIGTNKTPSGRGLGGGDTPNKPGEAGTTTEVLSTDPIEVLNPASHSGPIPNPPTVGSGSVVGDGFNVPAPVAESSARSRGVTLEVTDDLKPPYASAEVTRVPGVSREAVAALARRLGVREGVEEQNSVFTAGGLTVTLGGDFNYAPTESTGAVCQTFSTPCETEPVKSVSEEEARSVFSKAAGDIGYGEIRVERENTGRVLILNTTSTNGKPMSMAVGEGGVILMFSGSMAEGVVTGRYALVGVREAVATWDARNVGVTKCVGSCRVKSVSLNTMQLWSADGTSWKVPAYLLSDETGGIWQVPALPKNVLKVQQ